MMIEVILNTKFWSALLCIEIHTDTNTLSKFALSPVALICKMASWGISIFLK